jgi:hypothetical protein
MKGRATENGTADRGDADPTSIVAATFVEVAGVC